MDVTTAKACHSACSLAWSHVTALSSDHRPRPRPRTRTRTRTALLAATSAVTAANVYLNQPLLTAAAHDFHRAPALLGAVPTATQLGYALGIALLVPAGDSRDRRRLILLLGTAATLALTACALAPGVPWLVAASLALGLCSPVPQLVAPLAVALAGGRQPGRVLGTIQGGLLVGVLAARAYSGWLAQLCGWRAVYGCSAALTLLLTALLWRALPTSVPTGALAYRAALASLPRLFTGHAVVRRVTLSGALVGASFGAFWTALTFLLAQHYRYDSTEVGLFGLVAAASALASPPIGRLADRLGRRGALTALIAVVLAGWALLLPGGGSLGWLLAGVVVLDVGTWGNQVVCQSALFAAFPVGQHSRLNTCYFTLRFLGIAVGSLAGSLAWPHGGWPAVTVVGAAAAGAALAVAAGVGGGQAGACEGPAGGDRRGPHSMRWLREDDRAELEAVTELRAGVHHAVHVTLAVEVQIDRGGGPGEILRGEGRVDVGGPEQVDALAALGIGESRRDARPDLVEELSGGGVGRAGDGNEEREGAESGDSGLTESHDGLSLFERSRAQRTRRAQHTNDAPGHAWLDTMSLVRRHGWWHWN